MVSVGVIPCSLEPIEESAVIVLELEENEPEGDGTQAQRELRVYTRRIKQNEGTVPIVPLVPSPFSLLSRLPRHLHHPPQTQNTQVI